MNAVAIYKALASMGYRFTPEGAAVRFCRRTGADL